MPLSGKITDVTASPAASSAGAGTPAAAIGAVADAVTQAKATLRRWKNSGLPGASAIQHTDMNIVNTYLLLKAQVPRGSRLTPDQLLNALAAEQANQSSGVKIECPMWIVPKSNFPGGLPKVAEKKMKTFEYLSERFEIPEYLDLSEYWVVDKRVPLNTLGDDIETVIFYRKMSTAVSASSGLANRVKRAQDMEVDEDSNDEPAASPPGRGRGAVTRTLVTHRYPQPTRRGACRRPPSPGRQRTRRHWRRHRRRHRRRHPC